MNIRKIAVLGSFAAAAMAFAPLAAADPAAVDPLLPFVNSEIASMNALFVTEADLAGVGGDVGTHVGSFDIIPLADAPNTGTPTFLDYELYGLNPLGNATSDPGAVSEFNGALADFDNAYNVELFSLLNPTADIATIPLGDLFGPEEGINEALAFGTASGAITDFLTDGWNDLVGFFTPAL